MPTRTIVLAFVVIVGVVASLTCQTAPPPPAPSITLRAQPSTINPGQASTLTWDARNATTVSIEPGLGTVQATGNRSVNPTSSVTYQATARGPGGEATDTARITVNIPSPPPPPPPPRPPDVSIAQYVRIGNAGAIPNAGMLPPTILKSALALYTDDARIHGIEGTVTIEAVMGEDGQIKTMRVLKGLGFGLDEVALASVQEWVFSPATRDGLPVSVVAQIDVEFNLRSANALRVGNGVTPPTVLSRVEPQYTQEARLARLQGTVVLQVVFKSDGTVDVIRVVQGLAAGLTNGAVEALKQWKFRPGKKDGRDVDVAVNVEVNFNLR